MAISESWKSEGGRLPIGLIIGIILLVVMLGAGIFWLMRDNYGVLFNDLQPQDAAAIVQELERLKISHEIVGDGELVLVPEDEVHATRLKLMGSGVALQGGVGFEIFDDSGFGATEFAQKVNFQRALQGELTRTIMSLDEVKYARVHLVLPENGLFKRKDRKATASVTLFLRPHVIPTTSQIRGVQQLVAASVPQLIPDDVTVLDQNGVTLSRTLDSPAMRVMSAGLLQKQSIENYLKGKAEEVLARAFDANDFAISIDLTLDYSQSTTTHENVLPVGESGQGLLRRRESKTEEGGMKKTEQGRVTTEEEYMVGRSVSQTVNQPGTIKKMSVGVLVPENTSDTVIQQIKDLVSMAVGLDSERGDAIVVYPFATNSNEIPEQPYASKNSLYRDEPDMAPMIAESSGDNESSVDKELSGLGDINQNSNEHYVADRGIQGSIEMRGPSDMQVATNDLISSLSKVENLKTFGIIGLSLFGLLVIFVLIRSFKREKTMSTEEREQMLQTLKEWLDSDRDSSKVAKL